MDSSATAAHSLADALVALTNALGDASRLGDQFSGVLNQVANEASDEGGFGSAIFDHVIDPLNKAAKATGEWIGINQVVGFVARDVTADLRDLGVTFGHNSTATDEGTTASERHAAALRDEARASRNLKSALEDEHDADLTVRQGKLDVARAQARLTELRKDGKQKSFEYKQAELDLEVAQNRLRDANTKLRTATDRSTEAERTAASASTRAAGAHDKFATAAHDAGRWGLKFGDDVRDGILRIPKGRMIKIEADFGWQGLKVFRTPGGALAMAEGGLITQGTGPTADDVLIRASKREAVVPARATSDPWFQAWAKAQRIPGFAQGGIPAGGIGLDFKTFPISQLNRRIDEFEGGINQVLDLATARFKRLAERSAVRLTGGSGAGFGSGSWMRAIAELRRDHVPYNIISTFRPGARTHASGSVSFHALNRAVDLTGPNMLAIWRSLTDTNPTELIYAYAPMYKSRSGWHPIGRLDRVTWADHRGHVHAAYDRGGYLQPGWSWNGTGSRERVLDPVQTRVWEALEKRLRSTATPVRRIGLPDPPSTSVNVQTGAVQIIVQGSVARDTLPELRASVEDGLSAVLRELRTGTAA